MKKTLKDQLWDVTYLYFISIAIALNFIYIYIFSKILHFWLCSKNIHHWLSFLFSLHDLIHMSESCTFNICSLVWPLVFITATQSWLTKLCSKTPPAWLIVALFAWLINRVSYKVKVRLVGMNELNCASKWYPWISRGTISCRTAFEPHGSFFMDSKRCPAQCE
jgi:hypothetical protein